MTYRRIISVVAWNCAVQKLKAALRDVCGHSVAATMLKGRPYKDAAYLFKRDFARTSTKSVQTILRSESVGIWGFSQHF